MNFLSDIEKHSPLTKLLLGFLFIGVVGICDFVTGYELAFSLFYVIPVSYVAWLVSRRAGIMASVVSACVWLWADIFSGHLYSHPLIPVWNSIIRLSFFVIITLLLSTLKSALEREKEFARIDNLTGAVNSRLFLELLQMQIERSQRYKRPFTLAYIDLDNFKAVNDQYGHPIGDQALCTVVNYAKTHLRKVDVLARLGGDEFALLLPETNQESAEITLTRIQGGLLGQMRQNNWPITFSIGVVVCNVAPSTADELVRTADNLMYAVKRDSKNAIRYATYAG